MPGMQDLNPDVRWRHHDIHVAYFQFRLLAWMGRMIPSCHQTGIVEENYDILFLIFWWHPAIRGGDSLNCKFDKDISHPAGRAIKRMAPPIKPSELTYRAHEKGLFDLELLVGTTCQTISQRIIQNIMQKGCPRSWKSLPGSCMIWIIPNHFWKHSSDHRCSPGKEPSLWCPASGERRRLSMIGNIRMRKRHCENNWFWRQTETICTRISCWRP